MSTTSPSPAIGGSATPVSPLPAPTTAEPVVAGTSTTNPTSATTPPPAASAATPVPVKTAQLIIDINGTATAHKVRLAGPMNACQLLTAARDQGLIKSVSLKYYPSFNSYYVEEINGYENNWTFKVNGSSPKGCSLASVTQGDTVSWTYQ